MYICRFLNLHTYAHIVTHTRTYAAYADMSNVCAGAVCARLLFVVFFCWFSFILFSFMLNMYAVGFSSHSFSVFLSFSLCHQLLFLPSLLYIFEMRLRLLLSLALIFCFLCRCDMPLSLISLPHLQSQSESHRRSVKNKMDLFVVHAPQSTYIHTHIHIYIHTHIYTYIYVHEHT